jgi:mycothiol system anti-sigma-R factor
VTKCNQVIDRIYEYLNSHELTPEIMADIREHLDLCRHCFTRFEFEELLMTRLKSASCCQCPDSLKKKIKSIISEF